MVIKTDRGGRVFRIGRADQSSNVVRIGAARAEIGLEWPGDSVVIDRKKRKLVVTGWAVAPVPITQVEVSLGAHIVGTASYGHFRPDVGATYPDIPRSDHSGFHLEAEIADVDLLGEQNLSV